MAKVFCEFTVKVQLPKDMSEIDMQLYIEEAVCAWRGSYNPKDDPRFDIDPDTVRVKPYVRNQVESRYSVETSAIQLKGEVDRLSQTIKALSQMDALLQKLDTRAATVDEFLMELREALDKRQTLVDQFLDRLGEESES